MRSGAIIPITAKSDDILEELFNNLIEDIEDDMMMFDTDAGLAAICKDDISMIVKEANKKACRSSGCRKKISS